MPQMVTYSVSVKVDKGPEVKSVSTLEAGSYSASVEELVCRGAEVSVAVNAKPSEIEMLVIASSLYKNEKDPCPTPGQLADKCLKFKLTPPSASPLTLYSCCDPAAASPPALRAANGLPPAPPVDSGAGNWCPLTRPFILAGPSLAELPTEEIKQISFRNDLGSDVKVSVLVVRPKTPASCAC